MTSTEPAISHQRATSSEDGPRRRTRQRDAITTFLGGQENFATAQEIHGNLKADGVTVGLATVYRTLQAMAADGEIDVLRTDSGEAQYRRCSLHEHHHHLVCRRCGLTVEVMDEPVGRWADEIGRQHGFGEIEHRVEVFGTCATCQGG